MRKLVSSLPTNISFLVICIPIILLGQGSPVVIWTEIAHSRSIEGVAYSSDGQTVISGSAYDESTAKIWDATSSDLLDTFTDHVNGVQSVDISVNGKYLAVGYIVTDYASFGEMRLYDLELDNTLDTLSGCFVEFSSNGQLIASGGGGVTRYIYIHRLSDGQQLNAFYNGPGYIKDISFSPDNNIIAAACTDNTVKLWDISGDSLLHSIEAHSDDVSAVAISPDGKLVASGAGGWDDPGESTIKIWEIETGNILNTLAGHGDWVSALDFSPDGQTMVSSGRDGVGTEANPKIKSWSVINGNLINYYDMDLDGGVADLEYSPDGQSIIFGRGDGTLIKAIPPEDAIPSALPDQSINPETFKLKQNYPNPFNPSTQITYNLPVNSEVDLTIYNVLGQKIVTLVSEYQKAGTYKINWNAQNLPGGIYFYKLKAGLFKEIRKMTLVR